MVTCDYCGKEIVTPFKCNYCNGTFCEKHRLPPNHDCPGLESWKSRSGPEIGSHEKKKSWISKKKESLFQNISLPSISEGTEEGEVKEEKKVEKEQDRKESPKAEFEEGRMEGEVKFYDQGKSYGFIIPEDGGEDVYFKGRDVEKGWLEGGETVEFTRVSGDENPRAIDIVKKETRLGKLKDWWLGGGVELGKFGEKSLKFLKYLGGIIFILGCFITWISFFGLKNIGNLLPSQLVEVIQYLIPPSILSPVSTWTVSFFSNNAAAWENGALLSVVGFALFFSAWVVSKICSKYGRRFRDRTAFSIATKMGTAFIFSIIFWLFSLMILKVDSASVILENSWPRSWFMIFLIMLGSMGFYMGRIRRGSWWSKKKILGIVLAGVLLASFGYYRTHAFFQYNNLTLNKEETWSGGKLLASVEVSNIGGSNGIKNVRLSVGNEVVENQRVHLESGKTRTVNFAVSRNTSGEYSIKVGGLSKDFEVVDPTNNPIQYPDYYYGIAENYVQKNYGDVPNQNVGDLETFLLSLESFPSYDMDIFSCTESTARLEWLLEGAGFDAKVANDIELSEMDAPTIGGHTWVTVELQNGDVVAIEATFFTQSNYNPPGIIMKPDGTYKKYSWKYKMFQEWKEKYPSSQYTYDPNMTLSEWESEYLTELDLGLFSTPSQHGYYHPAETYKTPAETTKGFTVIPESQWDWWNVSPYSQTSIFSKWN